MDPELNSEAVGTPDNPEQLFKKSLEISQQVITKLATFAIENGANPNKLTHLTQVFSPGGHILLPPMGIMRKELAKVHGDTETTRNTQAITAKKTGQVFVPEESAGNVHDCLHESIHRASWLYNRLQGLGVNETLLIRAIATQFGLEVTPEGKIGPNSPVLQTLNPDDKTGRDELLKGYTDHLKTEVFIINEGLTEWVTQRADGLILENGQTLNIPEENKRYPYQVEEIEAIREKMFKAGIEQSKVDAILITAALTGDVAELIPYIYK